MYKAQIKDSEKSIEVTPDGLKVEGEMLNWDLKQLSDKQYHVIHHDKSYRMEIVDMNRDEKTVTVKINGKQTEIAIKDKMDLLLKEMGIDMAASAQVNDVKAPMPGLILDIQVTEGDEVKKGDAIMILEAMKMENVLKSPGDGTVKAIKVKQGDSVEKNQVLVEF